MLMQYTAIFHGCKIVYEAVLTSNHNLCFRVKIRKDVYPCTPQFYYIEVWCKWVYITRVCLLCVQKDRTSSVYLASVAV